MTERKRDLKIYLVRWPDLRATLVAAKDERGLLAVLGEDDDSGGATWSVYEGPLSVDLRLPAVFHVREKDAGASPGHDEIVVDDVSDVEDGLILEPARGARHVAMAEEVMRTAFPHLHDVLSSRNDELTEDGLRAAVRKELQVSKKPEGGRAAPARPTDSGGATADQHKPVTKRKDVVRPGRRLAAAPSKLGARVKPIGNPNAKKPKREPEPKPRSRGRRSGHAST